LRRKADGDRESGTKKENLFETKKQACGWGARRWPKKGPEEKKKRNYRRRGRGETPKTEVGRKNREGRGKKRQKIVRRRNKRCKLWSHSPSQKPSWREGGYVKGPSEKGEGVINHPTLLSKSHSGEKGNKQFKKKAAKRRDCRPTVARQRGELGRLQEARRTGKAQVMEKPM